MNRIVLILLGFLLFSPTGIRAETYRYTDHEGVVSLTDHLSKVPLEYRKTIEILEEADLAPLTIGAFPVSPVKEQSRLPEWFRQWFGQPSAGNILISSVLAFLLLFLVWRGVRGFLFKFAFLLAGVVLLGSILYNFVVPGAVHLKRSPSEHEGSRISQGFSTIQKANKLKDKIEETESARKRMLQSITQGNE